MNAIFVGQNERGGGTKNEKTMRGRQRTYRSKRIITITKVNRNNNVIFQ